MPDASPEELIVARDSKDARQCAKWEEFDSARRILAGEDDCPDFQPKADVATCTSYSTTIYHKIGLITEADMARLGGGCNPKLLKGHDHMRGIPVKLDGPRAPPTTLYPIALRGLPGHELQGMLKMKICHSLNVGHTESLLKSEDQISEQQGHTLFSLAATALNSNRPMMREPHKILTAQQMCDLTKAAEAASAADDPADESSEEDQDDDAPELRRGKGRAKAFTLGSLESKAKTSKTKAAAKGKASAKASAHSSQLASKKVSSGKDDRDESPSKQSSAKGGKMSKMLEEATSILGSDEEMLRVAKKHLATNKGSGVKCLQSLNVKEILHGLKPGNSLTGVGGCQNCIWFSRLF